MDFKVGDIVKLKSGSPVMTVSEIKPEQIVCCWYCYEKYEFIKWAFIPDMLAKADVDEIEDE